MALSVLLKSSFSLFLKILIAGTFSTVATINERPIIGEVCLKSILVLIMLQHLLNIL